MKEFFKQLAKDFSDKDYAHTYMESHAVTRLAAQVHTLRKQRGWSQEDLSEKSGLAQERISKIESADFNSLTMKTLQKLSRAFDVHLHVAFEPFSKGIVDIANLHPAQLEVTNRILNLETAFSDEIEYDTEDYSLTATTGPNVIRIMVGHGVSSGFLILDAAAPHALSSNDSSSRIRTSAILQKAQTTGRFPWQR